MVLAFVDIGSVFERERLVTSSDCVGGKADTSAIGGTAGTSSLVSLVFVAVALPARLA